MPTLDNCLLLLNRYLRNLDDLPSSHRNERTCRHQRRTGNQTGESLCLWAPVRLENGQFLIRFTFETGNGWLITDGSKMIDYFIHEGCRGYRSVTHEALIAIPCDDLILNGISPARSASYCVSVSPQVELPQSSEELFVMQQQ